MKNITKRLLPLLLALVLLYSSFITATASPSSTKIVTTPTGYTKASDVVYREYTGQYKDPKTDRNMTLTVLSNWGARGENAVFLTRYAANFYTGSNTYESFSQLAGSKQQNQVPQSALFQALQTFMESKHTFYTEYDGSKNVRKFYQYTDCVSNDISKVSLIYRGGTVTSAWNSGDIWNQEHCWPQSKCTSSWQIGDIMQLRPSNPSENSARGNDYYGESSSSDCYDPGISVRGDCARMMLYMYVRWGNTGKMWGSSGVIESVDTLLKWMAEDPVDTWEMGRNDSVQSITGTRNVFVDYPELAWLLFGRDVPANLTTPSGGKSTPSVTPTVPATQPTTPATQPTTQPTFPNTPSVGSASAINSMSQLVSGKYILVADSGYAPGVLDGTWITAVQPTVSGGKVTDAKGAVWTIIVSGGKVTLTDANGTTVAPKGGNNNGIKEGSYQWDVVCENGKFLFKGVGEDTVRLASNTDPQYSNKFRAYKESTTTGQYADKYPNAFTLYAVSAGSSTPTTPSTPATTPSTTAPTQAITPATQPTPPATSPTTPPSTQPTTPATTPSTTPNVPSVGNAGAINSISQLVSGQYILVTDSGYAPGVLDGTWITAVQPTVSGGKVTDAKGAVWTIIVSGGKVTLTDANGTTVAPKGGNNNGIKEGSYQWDVVCENGKFLFKGVGEDTVRLASNTDPEYGNKFRAYKESTATGQYADNYPNAFTLYAVNAGGSNPTTPGTQATIPATQPTTPATQATTPATQPGDSTTQPSAPVTQPTEPSIPVPSIPADQCTHNLTQTQGAKPATCGEEGYTGDKVCLSCGEIMIIGSPLPATGSHSYGDWITEGDEQEHTCTVCGHKQTRPAPQSDAGYIWIIVAVAVALCAGGGTAVVVIIRKRKHS